MKIKFLSGPRAGQIDHAPISQETDLLVKAGIIEVIPYKNWQAQLQHNEYIRQASLPKVPVTAQWGIKHSVCGTGPAVMVVKTLGVETTFYDAPPADCPPSTRQQWKSAVDLQRALSNDVNRIHKEKQEHYVREHNGGGASNFAAEAIVINGR
jgi:hypothetical protein